MSRSLITNFLLFQLGWFACVLGGAYDQALLGSLIAIMVIAYHFYQAPEAIQEFQLLMVALLIGFVFESIITSQGFARYSHGQVFDAIAPIWIILMWPLFATTLNLSMRWLKGLSALLIALIGALFAPLAYYAGNRIGAVEYDSLTLSMSLIAIAWAVLLPALVTMSLKLNGYSLSSINPDTQEHSQHV
jgi:uncharacterized membrane protein